MNDNRLQAIADMLPTGLNTAADIGTDHGKLGCYLLESGACSEMWFSDISEGSLSKAKKLVEERGLEKQAVCFLGDGAKPLPGVPDAAIIAGMGGNTISMIIEQGIEKLRNSFLVLQPNTHIFRLRQCLSEQGYEICDEKCVLEAGRMYIVIAAHAGKADYDYEQLLAGPVLMKKQTAEFKQYASHRLAMAEKALDGRKQAQEADITDTVREIEVWKKYC